MKYSLTKNLANNFKFSSRRAKLPKTIKAFSNQTDLQMGAQLKDFSDLSHKNTFFVYFN